MKSEELHAIDQCVNDSLDMAEHVWGKVEHEYRRTCKIASMLEAKEYASEIPGHPIVHDGKPVLDHFVAIVVDMRDSTKHMLNAIGGGRPSQLQRVFYETSALLPAIGMCIEFQEGKVTEYLGDGLLGLFSASQDSQGARRKAFRAGEDCLEIKDKVVNKALSERYKLPHLDIGVGISISAAIICAVGTYSYKQPKAVGECVFRASKLSGGRNEIAVDDYIQEMWPSGSDPKLRFTKRTIRNQKGHVISRIR